MNPPPTRTTTAKSIIDDVWTRRLSRIGAWVIFLLCGALAIVHLYGSPPDYSRFATNILISAVGLLSLVFLKLKCQRAAVFTMLIGGWVVLTLLVSISGGLYSNNVIVYPLIILLSGQFLGSKTSAWITAASIIAAGGLALLHVNALLPSLSVKPVIFPLSSFLAVVAMAGLGTWYFNRSLEDHVKRQRDEVEARVRAEQIADQRQQQLIDIADNIPGVVYQFFSRPDGSRGFHFISSKVKDVFGVTPDPANAFADLSSGIHPDDKAQFFESLDTAIIKCADWRFEGRFYKISDPDTPPNLIWFRGASSPSQRSNELIFSGILTNITASKDAEKRLTESIQRFEALNAELEHRVSARTTQLQDEINERKSVESVLRETANRLQQIIDTIDSGLLVWSPDQTLQLWNDGFTRLFPAVADSLYLGITRAELGAVMRSKGGLISSDERASRWEALGRFEVTLPDSRILEVTRIATPTGGRLIMHSEITEQRRQREALTRNERMAALGGLVAGVAHEINTPLGNALMVTSTLEDHLKDFDRACQAGPLKRSTFDTLIAAVRESTDQLNRNLLRSAELIQHFKQLAVDQTSDRRREFDLMTVLDNILATLGNRVRKAGHAFTIHCPPGIMMDSQPGAIAQIITNLVENAITHGFDQRMNGSISLHVAPINELTIEMVFADNGAGISKENQPRVFEPFFTTKLGQGGSGLGLSILLNLTRDILGGEVRLESTQGSGSRFIFTLPRTAPKPSPHDKDQH